MEIRASDGVELSFDIAGTDSPSFLFVHGGGADRSHLAPQFDFFSRRNRSINLDLRGYGRSGRPEKYGTIEQYAEDVAVLCNQLNCVEECTAENLSFPISFLSFFSGFSLTTQLLMNNVRSHFK